MGLRNIKRQIAKARLTVMGVGNVNKKLKLKKDPKDRNELPNWKKALYGKTGADAHRAQMNHGRLLKARNSRKIRRVET